MSKFFFKGTIDVMGKYGKSGYNPKPNVKPGSENDPLSLLVPSEARKTEIEAVLLEHDLFASIQVDAAAEENISELDAVLSTPKTQRFEKTPERNDPCPCGSGKKYKKCCR